MRKPLEGNEVEGDGVIPLLRDVEGRTAENRRVLVREDLAEWAPRTDGGRDVQEDVDEEGRR